LSRDVAILGRKENPVLLLRLNRVVLLKVELSVDVGRVVGRLDVDVVLFGI
jgi:hypothetical protein